MKRAGAIKLLGDILDCQIEDGAVSHLGRSRMYEALTSGPAFARNEIAVLFRSPHARALYKQVARDVRSEAADAVAHADVDTVAARLAAASGSEADKVEIQGRGFTVTLYRISGDGERLVILVRLGKAYMDAIHPMTRLRLSDTGGLEWLRGTPDSNGQLTSEWDDGSIDLVDRIRHHALVLEPV